MVFEEVRNMLELQVKNIGIVKEAKIELKGITAITGHNNSGKTTVSIEE